MSPSRYDQSRTLVRRLCKLPGEDAALFRQKVARLRRHFARFNLDAAELCQWLMGLKKKHPDPDNPASFGPLGDFLLEPKRNGDEADEKTRDRWRLEAFDAVAGFDPDPNFTDERLREAIRHAAQQPKSPTAQKLFDRLSRLEPAHRLVLLKSAAEWIVARYRRGLENWVSQHAQWQQEKQAWESAHPQLTPQIRDRFTGIFRKLSDPQRDNKPGLRRKNPRICPWDRLKQNLDNCCYAGEKGHSPLCWKYVQFITTRKAIHRGFNDEIFVKDAQKLLDFCVKQCITRPSNAFLGSATPDILFQDLRSDERGHALNRLKHNWDAYLKHMGLNGETVVRHGRLPHCQKIGKTYEDSQCQWNPHTEWCHQYKRALLAAGLDDATLQHEKLYRRWRKRYLAGPPKPAFKYPSSRDLPLPKIFGAGFHQIDFDRSVLRLRLDDMPAGDWLEFGFIPWPRHYRPSRAEVKVPGRVTSLHVNFVGRRARVGFRFETPHQPSRFVCAQDQIDELRSRRFPRQAQDREFLKEARQRLLKSFTGGAPRKELRLLAVDLGQKGAHAAVFQGLTYQRDEPLPIIKINRLYKEQPVKLEPDRHGRPRALAFKADDPRGLGKEHVGRHLKTIADGAGAIAAHRQPAVKTTVTLATHDFRGLKRHVAWMIRDWARLNAARIIALAEQHRCDLVVFESMRGFRLPGYEELDADKKQRLAMFAFGRVRRKVVEKAVERGMRVVTVPYFKSSQVCSRCGKVQQNYGWWRKNKKSHQFICEKCKARFNSDENAACVLARVFWGQITLPQPPED